MSIITSIYTMIKGAIMKEKIKKWYKDGLWTKEQVKAAVTKGVITEADYEEICGKEKSHGM